MALQAGPSNVGEKKSSLFPLTKNNINGFFVSRGTIPNFRLIDSRTMAAMATGGREDCPRGMFSLPSSAHRRNSLLVKFQDVLNPSGDLPPTTHGVEHHIITTGRPVTARFRRWDPEKYTAAKAAFAKLEQQGIIRWSTSCWASPLHMVRKADGGWRPCSDFRQLNLITEPDQYPLPRMDNLAGRLKGCRIFSKLDLKQGYH
jgi:hypothetical protein